MADKMSFVGRDILEYESLLGPKLFLIAEQTLSNDKKEIFDSPSAMEYLYYCFKSKFKAAETHVSYVKDSSDIPYTTETFRCVLEKYSDASILDLSNFALAFVGQGAFDAFYEDYDTTGDTNYIHLTFYKEKGLIKIYLAKMGIVAFTIPYIILPEIDDSLNNVPTLLNNITLSGNNVGLPYCTTKHIIEKFDMISNWYKEGLIKYFTFNSKMNAQTNKVEYFTIEDVYAKKISIYCPTDSVCKDDDDELKKRFRLSLRNLLTTVPVTGTDIQAFVDLVSYKDEIKIASPEDLLSQSEVAEMARRCFRIYDTKENKVLPEFNSIRTRKSDWYTQWHKETLPGLKAEKKIKDKENYGISKYEWIYDIEVFKNDWLVVAKTLDKRYMMVCWNDHEKLKHWIKDKILIGFNNAAYDDNVIRHMIASGCEEDEIRKDPKMSRTEKEKRLQNIKTVREFSDSLIYDDERQGVFSSHVPSFLSWDISFHMPFDIRRNSLKKLTMSVLNKRNYDSSVSFDTDRPLTKKEREDVEKYCELDVDNTLELFLPDPEDVKKKAENPKHKMRQFAKESYDIKWNLIVEYKMRARTLINKSSSFAGKVLCGEYAKPNPENTFKVVDGKRQYYKIPDLALTELEGHPVLDFYLKHQTNPEYLSEKFEYYMGGDDNGHKYQFGFGGLHQALERYGAVNLKNFDVASLYPSLIIEYDLMSRGAENPDAYKNIYVTRLEAKKTGKTLLNNGLKLILNGSIGAFLSKYNPLFDTWANSSICVHGQLLLFVLAKRLYEKGCNIVQTNTDGIMINKDDSIDYMDICTSWEKETRLVLEYDDIAILQQNNVNNYYCQFDNGKVKSKGFYLGNEKFGIATSKILCNIVTDTPVYENVLPRDFVIFKKHSIGEIYDGVKREKLEGRSLAFVVGFESDERTQSYYSRSRNSREVVIKDEKNKPVLGEDGKPLTEIVNTESKITGFTDHMLLVDDINNLKAEEINMQEYVNFAKNLLSKEEDFGPYYNENYSKMEEPTFLQALNQLKDHTDPYPTKTGVVCQNFLFESDCLTKDEQLEVIEKNKNLLYRVVWSGNKSFHCVVRLDNPVTSLIYKKIWYYLQHKLRFIGADEQCAVPSKYTRVPGLINPKTGYEQELYSFDKNILSLDEILNEMPKLKEEIIQVKEYKGQVTIKALERHINRMNWDDGNRFSCVQKLSPVLISQVPIESLLQMIPVKLDKDHKNVIRSKYYYHEKNKWLAEQEG